jgi:hypothetical protein
VIAGEDRRADCRRRLTAARASRSIAAMADTPRVTRARRSKHAARDKRLAQALRENLRRRKEQARAREPNAGDRPDKPMTGNEPPP